jgi:hypothetical protein
MLSLHRISLFRAGALLSMAKVFFRDNRDIINDDSAPTPLDRETAADTHRAPALP